MFKVLATGVVMANLAYLSRFWRPGRGRAVYQGLQAAAAGCSASCLLALLLSLAFPGPFRLGIYTIALNMLITPVSATAGFLAGVKKSPTASPGAPQSKALPSSPATSKAASRTASPASPQTQSKTSSQVDSQETPPDFAAVLAEVAGPQESPCEEA